MPNEAHFHRSWTYARDSGAESSGNATAFLWPSALSYLSPARGGYNCDHRGSRHLQAKRAWLGNEHSHKALGLLLFAGAATDIGVLVKEQHSASSSAAELDGKNSHFHTLGSGPLLFNIVEALLPSLQVCSKISA